MNTTEARHYAVIDDYNQHVTISYNGEIIAETDRAKILKEVGKTVYDPVIYVPKDDLKIELESEPERSSTCPIKGVASYWNLPDKTENYFAWSYEEPLPRSKKIAGMLAFNAQYVTTNIAPAT